MDRPSEPRAAPPDIGPILRAARLQRGWTREALAFYSGVSWAAIAQIETGRRRDVRLSSLSALATALGITVDYLIGAPPRAGGLLEHSVLVYASDDEFEAAAVPYLAKGVEHSEAVLAVSTPENIELLGAGLGDLADRVKFVESSQWYLSPSYTLDAYRGFLTRACEAGASWIRILGEPVWHGRSGSEVAAWARYEALINLAFAVSPASIVCPYDARALPADVVDTARRTHPHVTDPHEPTASAEYWEPERFLLASDET